MMMASGHGGGMAVPANHNTWASMAQCSANVAAGTRKSQLMTVDDHGGAMTVPTADGTRIYSINWWSQVTPARARQEQGCISDIV